MPKLSKLSPWQSFKAEWENCSLCSLCERRTRVVLCRGSLPCDVAFVGEAPGVNEDMLGVPFIGPAGKLLDEQIEEALEAAHHGYPIRMMFTNLVGCIPLGDNGRKVKEPPKECVEACVPRVEDLLGIARPKTVVAVGKLAQKHLRSLQQPSGAEWTLHEITHPAAILRAELARKPLMIQKTVVVLENIFADLGV